MSKTTLVLCCVAFLLLFGGEVKVEKLNLSHTVDLTNLTVKAPGLSNLHK
jgi:hypothetical protein